MKNVFDKIYKKHINKLKNLNVDNKKLIICFSGIPGSGKTKLAKILEEKYRGVRVNNDDLRKIIDKLKLAKDKKKKQEILQDYLFWFLDKYKFRNKLIILDSSIDRKYKNVFLFAQKKKLKVVIIRMKTSREEIVKRMKKIGKLREFLENANRWKKDYDNFNRKFKANFVFNNSKKSDLKKLHKRMDILMQ